MNASVDDLKRLQAIADDGVVLLRGSDVKPEPVTWLWRDWLAVGKLHVLAGAPGQGKTTIALAMAATITSGGRWPDGSPCAPANVLIWSGEDDPADTLVPRLLAMGADLKRVYFVSGTRVAGELQLFDPARDLVLLTAQAERIGSVALLVVDPVVSTVAGDSHKNGEVRRALQPLVDLAATLRVAVLGISHFTKGSAGRDPVERVTGSIAFGAVARIVMCAAKVNGKDGSEAERRILARAKSNIGPDDGGFEYSIEQTEVRRDITASMVRWGRAVDGTARELLAEAETEPTTGSVEQTSALEGAVDFLRQLLTGPTPSNTVQAEAKQAGLAWATVRRAADTLDVIRKKGSDGWYWQLPFAHQHAHEDAQGAQALNVEHLEQVDEQVAATEATDTDAGVL